LWFNNIVGIFMIKDRFNELKRRLRRRMMNANGIDTLSRDALLAGMVLGILNIFLNSSFVYVLSMASYFYSLFRIFSTNKSRRRFENETYMTYRWRLVSKVQNLKKQIALRKAYRYLKCPNCGQKLRVPRKQGKIEVHCPKCGHHFDSRS